MTGSYLVILGYELVQTFLDDVVAVEVFNQDNDMEAQSHDNRVDLIIVFEVSLHCPPVSD